MKELLLVLICFCTYFLKRWNEPTYLLEEIQVTDTIPKVVDSKHELIDSSLIISSNNYEGAAKYSILYPSPIEHHIVITQ